MQQTMEGVTLPGNRRVEMRTQPVPEPGPGQALVQMKASSICGSDIRAIYREHLGVGDEAYRNVIAGHEPCGQIEAVGPGCKEFRPGDRVVLYHIAGCGLCDDCKGGYMISCHSPLRAAYGWQRDGGHAPYLLAEESTCVRLPDNLSYVDGALAACGFGTVWEALTRMRVDGRDRLLVTGLGPVGLAAAMLGRALGARHIIGVEAAPARLALALELGLVDQALPADAGAAERVMELTHGAGCEASIDCSGAAAARSLAVASTRAWGRCALIGEGGRLELDASPMLIHKQLTLFGSWVTSLPHLAELLERLSRWNLHPESTVTHRFPLTEAAEAYRVADAGQSGKVTIVFDELPSQEVKPAG